MPRHARRSWYGFGAWDYATAPYAAWCERNRATSGVELSTGHGDGGFLRANHSAFKAHPEYLGLVGGVHGEVHDSAGRAVFWLNGREPNYYAVPVPAGEDGRLWSIKYGRGAVRLLTVPPPAHGIPTSHVVIL